MAAAGDGGRWVGRPWRARALRAVVYLLPIVGSLLFVRAAATALEAPTSSLGLYLAWWFALSLGATGVVALLYACTRRLLPLGALLELSLVFPDEAPSRFRVAMQTGTVTQLEARLRAMDDDTTPAEAAEILLRLVAALDVHDHVTRGHAERVRAYAASIGRELGLPADELERLNWSALLHDIGKLDVSTEILNKPGRPPRRSGSSCAAIRCTARHSSRRSSAGSAPGRAPSGSTTSGGTARATRAESRVTTSRSPAGSSPSRTSST